MPRNDRIFNRWLFKPNTFFLQFPTYLHAAPAPLPLSRGEVAYPWDEDAQYKDVDLFRMPAVLGRAVSNRFLP